MSSPTADIYTNLNEILYKLIIPSSTDFVRLLPDGLVLGVGFLAFISFCKSYGMLLVSMLELMFIQRIASNAVAAVSPILGGPNSKEPVCQNGFMYKNLMRVSIVETLGCPSQFPSPTMFFLAGSLAYMVSCVQEFNKEITTLGGDISNRKVLTVVFSGLFLFLVFMFRIIYGCEQFGPLLLSLVFGLIFGILIMQQNKILFGRESVNIMNLPIIITAAEMGKPMFVCGPTDSSSNTNNDVFTPDNSVD
jgi:hypothetical protein